MRSRKDSRIEKISINAISTRSQISRAAHVRFFFVSCAQHYTWGRARAPGRICIIVRKLHETSRAVIYCGPAPTFICRGYVQFVRIGRRAICVRARVVRRATVHRSDRLIQLVDMEGYTYAEEGKSVCSCCCCCCWMRSSLRFVCWPASLFLSLSHKEREDSVIPGDANVLPVGVAREPPVLSLSVANFAG